MRQNYMPINLYEEFNAYETMWKEDNINCFSIQSQSRCVTLKDIWPKHAHVRLLVHGKYETPTWTFNHPSDCRYAITDQIQQFMSYHVINVSYLPKNEMGETDIKIEVVRPGYQIGDQINKAS